MKRFSLLAALLLSLSAAQAQTNIQELYDFNRKHLATTLEMFKGDGWGSTFFFTDIYHPTDLSSPTGFYTEISRSLNFWRGTSLEAFSAHVEWNGGQMANNAWLLGVEYFVHSQDFSNTFTFSLMYKRISGSVGTPLFDKVSDVPLQFTFVWNMNRLFGVEGLSFSGFLDVWGENQWWLGSDYTKMVLLSEPQLWYAVGRHFGCENLLVGGEVELAYNFAGGCKADFVQNRGFTAAPCLGVKWVF